MPFLVPGARRLGRPVLRAMGGAPPTAPAAPDTPNTPSPATTATAYSSLLSWLSARQAHADIYFGTSASPPLLVSAYVGTSWIPPTLAGSTTYYWKIVASNDGGSATGPIWSFSTVAATAAIVSLAGTIIASPAITGRVRSEGLSIRDVLNAAPNTGSLTIDTTAPTSGQAITIGLGTLDAANLLFGGEIQADDPTYVGIPTNGLWPVTLIDYTFALNKRRPFGTWVTTSASIIARYLVATFAPGFTANHVQDTLPAVSITFDGADDFMACMSRLATAITATAAQPGQTKVDYSKDVWLFLVDATDPPDPIDLTHPPLGDQQRLRFTTDLSQIRTRVFGKGHGETVPCDVAAGETIVPIGGAVLFTPTGGSAIASTTADGAQSQILTYAGVQLGGGGSMVGTGATPAVAPVLTLVAGTTLGTGVYQYAYTDMTGAGESLPSPIASVTTGVGVGGAAPTLIGTAQVFTSLGGLTNGGTYRYKYTFRRTSDGAETLPSPASNSFVADANGSGQVQLSMCATPPIGYTRKWYRTKTGGATYFACDFSVGGGELTTGTWPTGDTLIDLNDDLAPPRFSGDGVLGAAVLETVNGVALTGIATGAAAVTSRKVYRTAVNAAQLQLLTTLADNVTTTFADATADGALGANAPTSDTSGLTQPSGQVNAGSTTLLTASAANFFATGGWVSVGGQVVRYTGVSGNTLTGIPASGPGAITATVLYGNQILSAPALTGVNHNNGLTRAVARGSSVNIWVQRDDLAAQTALGLLELDAAGLPTDGIREFLIVDARRGEVSLTALVDADLAQFSRPIVTCTYQTRDPKTKSGKSVYVNTVVGPVGFYVIQDVTITFDGPALYPRYSVSASSVRFTLEDLLRRVVIT